MLDGGVRMQAIFNPDESLNIGESGVLMSYRQRGGGSKRSVTLYNRACIPDGIRMAEDESLTITWELAFTALSTPDKER